jgi:WD40 repeat protein
LAAATGSVQIWYNLLGQKSATGHLGRDRLLSLTISPEGGVAAIACRDTTVKIWDLSRRQVLRSLSGHEGPVYGIAFSPDGRLVASAGADGKVCAWDTTDWQLLQTLRSGPGQVLAVAFDRSGRLLAAGGDERTVVTWRTTDWQQSPSWGEIHDGPIRGLAFSPDGSSLATASADQTVQIRDIESGRLIRTLKLSELSTSGPFSSVAFSPDGRQIVAACASVNEKDGTAVVWDTHTGAILLTLTGHVGQVYDARFSPDGRRIITAGEDHTVKLWDSTLGIETFELRRDDRVTSVAMTPDGLQLVAACWDGTITVWDARPIKRIAGQGATLFQP